MILLRQRLRLLATINFRLDHGAYQGLGRIAPNMQLTFRLVASE
jgi:hypothetical protein